MSDLAALIERLEGANGPLDEGGVAMLIAALRGTQVRKFTRHTGDGGEGEMSIQFSDGTMAIVSAHRWPDRSVDAAIGYVPIDMDWLVRSHDFRAFANVNRRGERPNEGAPCWPTYAATAELAHCASILKARTA